ncbi:MAG: ABC transporter permease DevC [Gemmataceae bacterium]|nr:ABC transporter permease DevC [Gemmataceae bacterium]
MRSILRVAWRQLSYHKMKLAVAAAGVVVAVMLMLVQLGIRQGAIDNSVAVARRITADLVVVSPRTKTIFQSSAFPRRLLFRIPGHPAIDRVQAAYMSQAKFRSPWDHQEFPISVYGVDPRDPMMDLPGLLAHANELELADRTLFDRRSRKTYGPVAKHVEEVGPLMAEINYRKVKIVATVNVGISISTDGNLYMSPANFHRLFPARDPGNADLGLIRLKPGLDPELVRKELEPYVGNEARIVTRQRLVADEEAYLRDTAPLDFIFGMGAAVGFFIGFVVVYQILYTEVTNHLPQFATLKAMGFSDRYLLGVVLSQSFMLAFLGFFPGFVFALGIYKISTKAIQMEFDMTLERAVAVFLLTVFMCGLSGIIAIRKAWTADPADVF